jgi:thioredoxin 2
VATTEVSVCPNCGAKNRVPAARDGAPRCGRCGTSLPWTATADDGTFDDVVERSDLPVLLDLWAPWCGPCRIVSPALERLARRHAGRVKLVKVDVDEAPRTAERYQVRGIPTLLVVRDGEVVARRTGAASEADFDGWLQAALPDVAEDSDASAPNGEAADAAASSAADARDFG